MSGASDGTATVIESAAVALVASAGAYFLALGGALLAVPSQASRFLLGFAGSASKHYAELALRFVVGTAFVFAAPHMQLSALFRVFGWVLIGTTLVLLCIPWHWHRRFAQRAVPGALRRLPFLGISSAALGALVLWAVFRGNSA